MRSGKSGILYGVILVGGMGVRLRPISSPATPKAFLPVTADDRTMFRKTVDRIAGIIPLERVIVVANKSHAKLVIRDVPRLKKRSLLLEPVGRNTAPAVAFAAYTLLRRDPGAMMAILPADHYVADDRGFSRCIERGVRASKLHGGSCVTIGIKPAYPATGFGYIGLQGPVTGGAMRVRRFVEKPSEAKAKRYLRQGGYVWNSGIFIISAARCVEAFKTHAPQIARLAERIPDIGIERSYRSMPSISMDYAIAERLTGLYCVPGEFGWTDLGSFDALRRVLERELGVRSADDLPVRQKCEPVSLRILRRIRALQKAPSI